MFYPKGNLRNGFPFTPPDGRKSQRHFTADRHLRTLRRRTAHIQQVEVLRFTQSLFLTLPLRNRLQAVDPHGPGRESSQFSPPHRCRASLAETYLLLRVHLRPRTHRLLLSLLLIWLTPEGEVSGFPQILRWAPVSNSILNHAPGLSTNWASRYHAR